MIRNYKQIPKIAWPIFRLPSEDWHVVDGLVFMEGKIIDDRNMPGNTLGLRRLQTPHLNLFPLNKGSYSILFLLKHRNFIDSKGRLFIYEKTKMAKLKCHPISKITKKDTSTLIWLKDISYPFEVRHPPQERLKFCRILYLDNAPWTIYDFAESASKDTVRKI